MTADKKLINVEQVTQDEKLSRMGELLVANAKLTIDDVERILALQKEKNILFGEAAKELLLVKDDDIKKVLAHQYDYLSYYEVDDNLNSRLTAAHKPFEPEVEKLRSLRSQLMLRWFEHGHKTLAVTSCFPEDGASTMIANMAIVFSQLGKKTLLIDANLRQPKQHTLFGINARVGLSNILANRKGNYELSKHQSLPNLSVLTAGTEVPNPQELLTKDTFKQLINDLEAIYDIVLIDTCPASLGSDYLTVVIRSKGAIVVARKDHTSAPSLKVLKEELQVTNADLVGSVIQEF